MVDFNVYKDGKTNIVTFSYDDGTVHDRPLVELFNKYGLKATFHLNSARLGTPGCVAKEEIATLYKGHEVACHTVHHPSVAMELPQNVVLETIEDRRELEKLCGYPVRGMSYPNGSVSDMVIKAMESCGIVYSRTTLDSGYKIPENFMRWNGTCHHRNGLARAKEFKELFVSNDWRPGLLYIWGHSFELARNEENNSFEYMEEICREIADNEKIWYATNIEIYDYIMAQRNIIMTIDESIVTNPTYTDVWIKKDGNIVKIPAGQTVKF